jgi:hypothetical protein
VPGHLLGPSPGRFRVGLTHFHKRLSQLASCLAGR